MTTTAAIADREVVSTTLQNGIRIVTERMPHVRSVSVGVWVAAGSRHETPAENGISHFLEHMLFKGTTSRSAEQIAREVDSVGGHLDAFTAKEMVSYNTKVLDEHLPKAFDVLSDLVLNPVFDPADIDKEKGVILEELKMEEDNPEYLVHETFLAKLWPRHPLGRAIIGTRKTIQSFSRAMLSDYHARVYQPANLTLTAAGHLEHDRLVDLASESFGQLARREPVPQGPAPVAQPGLTLKRKRLQQVHLCLGVPSVPLTDERRYGCYLLNTVLGGGMSSRLFQNIRERQGLAYAVYSELSMYRDTGSLVVSAGTAKNTVSRVIESILSELRQLRDEPLPEEELRRAKDHLKGSLMLSLESTSSRMANLARQEMYFQRHFTLDEMISSIEGVTAGEIQALARDTFQSAVVSAAILGQPDGDPIGLDQFTI